MSIRLKLSLLISVLFIAAISNTFFTFTLEKYGEEKLKWVTNTHEILHRTQALFSDLKDTETGQRGYLLTSDTSYLEPYHTGVVSAKEGLEKLRLLTLDNPSQQKLLAAIEKDIARKFSELDETIQLAQSGRTEDAISIVSSNLGKQYMDAIRVNLMSFSNAERILLEARKGDFRESRSQLTTLIAIEIVFFIGLAIITFTFLQRNFFQPLQLLLKSVKKVESGGQLEITDIVEKDEMGHLLSTFFVMSENVSRRVQELGHKAHHDELTGLKNRIQLKDEIKTAVNNLERTNDRFAIHFLDLNLFKQVNDQLGHDIGDEILQKTASRLNHSVRNSDTVFRIGGDEFLILIRDIKNSCDVSIVAEKIINAFSEPAIIQGKSIDISISIGSAVFPDDSIDTDELIKFSDIAMYKAKENKGSSYKKFDSSMIKHIDDEKITV